MSQYSRSNFKTAKNNSYSDALPSGTTTRSVHRTTFEDLADSVMFIEDNFFDSVDTATYIFEDFDSIPQKLSLISINNGGGSGTTVASSTFGVDGTENANGVMGLSTQTSTAGGAAVQSSAYAFTFGFGFTHTCSFRCALETLSDGTNTYKVRIGYIDGYATAAAAVDGAYFRYTHSVNSGKWEAVTVSNSTETAEDTGITADVTTYHVFKIVVNSTATQVDFYIDGVKTNDITTNIINSSSRLTGNVAVIEKTAGSTSRSLYVDYFEKITQRSTAR